MSKLVGALRFILHAITRTTEKNTSQYTFAPARHYCLLIYIISARCFPFREVYQISSVNLITIIFVLECIELTDLHFEIS